MHSINCLIKTSSNSEKQRPPSRTVTSSSKTCLIAVCSELLIYSLQILAGVRQLLLQLGTNIKLAGLLHCNSLLQDMRPTVPWKAQTVQNAAECLVTGATSRPVQCSIAGGGVNPPLDEDDLPSGGRKFWSRGVGFDLLTAVPTKISEWERRFTKNVDSLLAVSALLLVIQQLLITYRFFFGQYSL